MMNRILASGLLAVLVVTSSATSVFGAERRARVRNKAQRARIHEGVKSGEVTRGEAAKLRREQARIHQAERRARRDGNVTPAEKARIERMQNKASRDIYKAKHNDVKRPGADGGAPEVAEPNAAPPAGPAGDVPTGETSSN